jgi:hypothetical protein
MDLADPAAVLAKQALHWPIMAFAAPDAPSLGKDHPGPPLAPRAGLFALHLGKRLTFFCGTDGICILGSKLQNPTV